MSCQSIKQVVKAMCEATAGGREAMAGALGLSLTSSITSFMRKTVVVHLI